jgi:photosystem II stability/assembly factor-like uncharacterized protein
VNRVATGIATLTLLVGGIGWALPTANADSGHSSSEKTNSSEVFVGGDLHTLTLHGAKIFLTGHERAVVSSDGGQTWKSLPTLDGADIMGWSSNAKNTLAGGHNGLYISNLTGETFIQRNLPGDITDIHALGASGEFVYLASPQAGFMASVDGGITWETRNQQLGQAFMGSMMVDPLNQQRVLVADMQSGLIETTDGGLTWRRLGGPAGPMAIAWDPQDRNIIGVVGMESAGLTKDGGLTWSNLDVPAGGSALAFSPEDSSLYVAAFNDGKASVHRSTNEGKSWGIPAEKKSAVQPTHEGHELTPGMDPNMPGMDHNQTEVVERPLKAVLGIFGLATALVLASALVLRRRDSIKRTAKHSSQRAGVKNEN